MRVCPQCGRVIAQNRHQCPECRADYTERITPPPIATSLRWVLFSGSFTCEACRFPVPLTWLDPSGQARCNNCGHMHTIEAQAWSQIADRAHAIGDLTGGTKPAPDSPLWAKLAERLSMEEYDQIRFMGVDRAQVETTLQAASREYVITAAPGAPLCDQCRTPLQLTDLDTHGGDLQCPRCEEKRRYTKPAAPGIPRGLLLAVTPEHQAGTMLLDAPDPQHPQPPLACPKCDAQLDLPVTGNLARCDFCDTRVILRDALLGRMNDPTLERPFWVLYRGESALMADCTGKKEGDRYLEREEERLAMALEMEERSWERRRAAGAGRLRSRILYVLFIIMVAGIGLTLFMRLGIRDKIHKTVGLTGGDDEGWGEPTPTASASIVRGKLTVISPKGDTELPFATCVYDRARGAIHLRTLSSLGSTLTLPLNGKRAKASLFLLRKFKSVLKEGGGKEGCTILKFSFANRSRAKREVSLSGTLELECATTLLPLRRVKVPKESVTVKGTITFKKCQ